MTLWTPAIQSSLGQALTAFRATSQLLCLCLNTGEGESQFTSSREVISCSSHCFCDIGLCTLCKAMYTIINNEILHHTDVLNEYILKQTPDWFF